MEAKVILQGFDNSAFIEAVANRVAEILLPLLQPNEEEKLLTSQEVCKLLSITPQTLNNYCKKGRLQPLRSPGRLYFKKEQVLGSLQTLKKYNREIA